ncbi:MAG: SBBP repeat-containing protein, partial [Candidatus Solibacter sp.]
RLIGATPRQGMPDAALPGMVNYLVGNQANWKTGIPTYSRVQYPDAWPGIDVIYYGSDGNLEYDFVVAPGANLRNIELRYEGATRLRLDAKGALIIESAAGELRQPPPVIYQEIDGRRRSVAGGYVLRGQTVHFATAAYDHRHPLVIDPVLTWAGFFGSNLTDQVLGITSDAAGNVFATGSTLSASGDYDAFVTKLDPKGTTQLAYALVGGPLGDDEAYGIAVDPAGNVYVAGYTGSDYFPSVGVSASLAGAGYDGFIAKIDPTFKTYVYSGYIGGENADIIYRMALDASNNLWVTGATLSARFPTSRSGAQRTPGGGIDGFVSQFDASGALLYSSYIGGTGNDYGFGVAIDPDGNVYLAGSTTSTDFPVTAGVLQPGNAGGVDAWAAKLAPSGTVTWSTYLGGSGDDEATAVAVDGSGSVYITGDTASANFPLVRPFQAAFGGGPRDMFAAKLAPNGATLAYSSFLGGSGDDFGAAIVVDSAGVAYVGGSTNSSNFPSDSGFQTTLGGGVDGTITAVGAAGDSLQFSSYMGGTLDDYVNVLSVSCTTGLLLGGVTASTNFPVTAGVLHAKYVGGPKDGFIAQVAAGTGTAAVIAPGGIVNAATSASAPVSPGSLVSLYGASLSSGIAAATVTPLTTTLGGATVTVNGTAVPLVYVSPGQINFQLPYETSVGTASAIVTAGCGASTAVTFQVVRAAPYFLLAADGSALVQNQDFTFNSASNAAPKASIVTAYLIGIGSLDGTVATGAAAPTDRLLNATLPAKATIGGFDTSIKFLGLTPGFVGLAQANLEVPNLSPGKYTIVLTVDGVESNAGSMWVK